MTEALALLGFLVLIVGGIWLMWRPPSRHDVGSTDVPGGPTQGPNMGDGGHGGGGSH